MSIITILLAVLFAVPIYLIIINSLKPYRDIFADPLRFPFYPTFDNFKSVWKQADFIKYFLDTVISTSVGLGIAAVVSSLAPYKLSRTRTRPGRLLFFHSTVSMLLSFEVIMLPLVQLLKKWHTLNNLAALGLIEASTKIAFSIFLYHGFIKPIPVQLDEAARIDGCGEVELFIKIIFPLIKPITSTVIVLNTLTFWNSFLFPFLVLTKKEVKMPSLFTYSFTGQYSSNYDLQLPAAMLTGPPSVIFYLIMQKNIIKGLTMGSVKG